MPLYPFDDAGTAPNDIYTVLVTQAIKLLQNDPGALLPAGYCNSGNTSLLSGAQSFYGLSEVVKAQWDKECMNLTLYNRKMVYDQDFTVKNSLIVAPEQADAFHALNAPSFADPVIQTNTFEIEPGVTVNMAAGEQIRLNPGFRAKAGCEFRARIIPSSCTDGMSVAGGYSSTVKQDGQGTEPEEMTAHKTSNSNNEDFSVQESGPIAVYITPNPNDGKFSVRLSDMKTTYSISVSDMMGREIFYSGNNTGNSEINISSFPQGIYFVKITSPDGITTTEKIVYQ
jgi:hypothetical protein